MDRRAGHFVGLLQPDLKPIGPAGMLIVIGVVGRFGRRGVVVTGNPNVIGPRCSHRAGQRHVHAGVARIDRPVVAHFPYAVRHRGRIILLFQLVVGIRDHRLVGIDQLDHGVERKERPVDVDPDFRAGRGLETVDIDVLGRLDKAVGLEPEPQVLVAPLERGGQRA